MDQSFILKFNSTLCFFRYRLKFLVSFELQSYSPKPSNDLFYNKLFISIFRNFYYNLLLNKFKK